MNPLINRTVTVPVGATGARLDVPGRHVKIVSCTVASVLLGFDASTPERVYPDDRIVVPMDGFQSLLFVDDLGAGSTVVVQISPEPIGGGTVAALGPLGALVAAANALLATIDADTGAMVVDLAALEILQTAANGLLTTIDADVDFLAPSTTSVALAAANIGQDGIGDSAVVAADVLNRSVTIQADYGNAGYVYLSHANPATSANWFACLEAGGSWSGETTQEIRACSDNGTEDVHGVIRRA